MLKILRWVIASSLLAVVVLLVAGRSGRAARPGQVRLPADFRSWTHVKSMAFEQRGHGMYGFHNVYANPSALKALRSGQRAVRYPAGATFVVSLYEVTRRDGMIEPGAKRRDVVQLKDPGATATGGWRFAAFDPTGQRIVVDEATCFSCHAEARERDHVLTRFAH